MISQLSEDVTFETVVKKLRELPQDRSDSDHAMQARSPPPPNQAPRLPCNICANHADAHRRQIAPTHSTDNCWQDKECPKCGRKGHPARRCKFRKPAATETKPDEAKVASFELNTHDVLYYIPSPFIRFYSPAHARHIRIYRARSAGGYRRRPPRRRLFPSSSSPPIKTVFLPMLNLSDLHNPVPLSPPVFLNTAAAGVQLKATHSGTLTLLVDQGPA
ncbi:hypothetical protein HDU97_009516, partial [Phlyctochytrium planicorne]